MENLNIKGMIKNRRIAKSIADQGLATFVEFIKCKTYKKGGLFVQIGRFEPSTKLCSSCGHKQPMPLSARTYVCSNCGFCMDRDLNAALNIRQIGIQNACRDGIARINACGDITPTVKVETSVSTNERMSKKQEKVLEQNP